MSRLRAPSLEELEAELSALREAKALSVDAWHRLQAERGALEAAAIAANQKLTTLQQQYDELTGERFSDRVHPALKSRAELAEQKLATLQTAIRALIKKYEWTGLLDEQVASELETLL